MTDKDDFITATQILKGSVCPHALYLEYFGDPRLKRPESDAERLVREQGVILQEEIVSGLGEVQSMEPARDLEAAAAQTLELMQKGTAYISQGTLMAGRYAGVADILRRVPGPSLLGNFSYEPVEIKSHRHVQFQDRLQLLFYAFLLEPLLGSRPARGWLVNGEGKYHEITFRSKLERQFEACLELTGRIRSGEEVTRPYRSSVCSRCLWSNHCRKVWEEENHLSLISGLSAVMMRKLEKAGVMTCRDLASCDSHDVAEILGVSARVSRRFILSSRARMENRPIILSSPDFSTKGPVYFYDIETCNDVVFCHGIVRVDGNSREERSFFAARPENEKEMWYEFLDYISRDDNPRIYCWTLYERQFVELCWNRYGGNKRGYENLHRGLTDQCAFVRNHFVLPCRGYSIKAVAPWFGFRWKAEDANGMNCVAWYVAWLETGDMKLREKIMQYNLDDVRAMVVIDEKLREYCA